jgi:hypothetical protein
LAFSHSFIFYGIGAVCHKSSLDNSEFVCGMRQIPSIHDKV